MPSRFFTSPQQGKSPQPGAPQSTHTKGNSSQISNESGNPSSSNRTKYVRIRRGDAAWTALQQMGVALNGSAYTIQIAATTIDTPNSPRSLASLQPAAIPVHLPAHTVTKLTESEATTHKPPPFAQEPLLIHSRTDSVWANRAFQKPTNTGPPPRDLSNCRRSAISLPPTSTTGDIFTMPPAQSNAAGPRAVPPRTSIAQPGPSQNTASSGAQHGTSRIWFSSEARIQRAWFKLEPHLTRMYPEGGKSAQSLCPYIPRNIRDFTTHLSEFEDLKLGRTKRILDQKGLMQSIGKDREGQEDFAKKVGIHDLPLPTPRDAFDGKVKDFGSVKEEEVPEEIINPAYHSNPANRSAVLSQQTIWCVNNDVPWREAASWPTMQEMKWEGIQRVSTENGKYGRFLALPRVPAAPEISWQTLPLTKFYPFDEVWRIPNEEDVFAPTEDIPEELESTLLNKDILDAVDPVNSL